MVVIFLFTWKPKQGPNFVPNASFLFCDSENMAHILCLLVSFIKAKNLTEVQFFPW